MPIIRPAILCAYIALAAFCAPADVPDAKRKPGRADQSNKADESPKKELFSGKVTLLKDALQKRGVKAYSEEIEKQVVLVTEAGELIPILPDWRGRAFFQDKRLRDRKVDLVGYRKPGIPYLQVLIVFTFNDKGERQYTDYWCDVCSIPMYEIKPCDCCQAPIRLRFQTRALPDYLDDPRKSKPTEPKPAVANRP